MTGFILDLLTGDFGQWVLGALAAAVAFIGYGAAKKHKGRKEERQKQKELDNEKAADIRDRADAVKPVHDDDIEFRD